MSIEIPLTQGKVALIDRCDIQLATSIKWQATCTHKDMWYAKAKVKREGKRTTIAMHRLIMEAQKGQYIDHINRNGLDNRRRNLRFATSSQNMANTGKYSHNTTGLKGVVAYRKGWRAYCTYKNQMIQSKTIGSKHTCALLRDEIARRLYGEYAYLNYPGEQPLEWIVNEVSRLIALHELHFY